MSNEAPTDALRLIPRRAVYDWLRDDVPLNVKMTVMPHHIDALMDRLSKAAPASPLPGGGDDDTVVDLAEALRLLEEVAPLAICWATHYASSRGFEQHPHHKALNEQIRAFLARNGKGEGG